MLGSVASSYPEPGSAEGESRVLDFVGGSGKAHTIDQQASDLEEALGEAVGRNLQCRYTGKIAGLDPDFDSEMGQIEE